MVATESIFNNNLNIARSEIIGLWKLWRSYVGCVYNDFMHDNARVVLTLCFNASATERLNNMYKHAIGLPRCRMNNDRVLMLVYTYVNSKLMKCVYKHHRKAFLAEAKYQPFFELPKLIFDSSNQDPQVFGSLAHDSLTRIGFDTFICRQ